MRCESSFGCSSWFLLLQLFDKVVSQCRYNLISEGLYGNPSGSLQENLNRVFADFRAWCKNNKVYSSQRCFTVGMDSWTILVRIGFLIFPYSLSVVWGPTVGCDFEGLVVISMFQRTRSSSKTTTSI